MALASVDSVGGVPPAHNAVSQVTVRPPCSSCLRSTVSACPALASGRVILQLLVKVIWLRVAVEGEGRISSVPESAGVSNVKGTRNLSGEPGKQETGA